MQHQNLFLIVLSLLFLNTLNAQISISEVKSPNNNLSLNNAQTYKKEYKDLDWEFSIFGFVSPVTSIRKNQNVLEFGGIVEANSEELSPFVNFAFGYSYYKLHEYTEDTGFSFLFKVAKAHTGFLRASYHFLPDNDIQPFMFVGFKVYQILSGSNPNVISLGGGNSRGFGSNLTPATSFREIGGFGLNWNVNKLHHLRIEGTYARGVELKVAYGININ